jgi:hypothetical protein
MLTVLCAACSSGRPSRYTIRVRGASEHYIQDWGELSLHWQFDRTDSGFDGRSLRRAKRLGHGFAGGCLHWCAAAVHQHPHPHTQHRKQHIHTAALSPSSSLKRMRLASSKAASLLSPQRWTCLCVSATRVCAHTHRHCLCAPKPHIDAILHTRLSSSASVSLQAGPTLPAACRR